MLIIEAQGCYDIEKNILNQDNQSTILLETKSFEKGFVTVVYCQTGEMLVDFMSKQLQVKMSPCWQ